MSDVNGGAPIKHHEFQVILNELKELNKSERRCSYQFDKNSKSSMSHRDRACSQVNQPQNFDAYVDFDNGSQVTKGSKNKRKDYSHDPLLNKYTVNMEQNYDANGGQVSNALVPDTIGPDLINKDKIKS